MSDTDKILSKLDRVEQRVVKRIDDSTKELSLKVDGNTNRIVALETKVDQAQADITGLYGKFGKLQDRFYKWLAATAGGGGALGFIAKLIQEAIF